MKTKNSSYLNWKKALVKNTSNLELVIKKLQKTALQIVLVVGKKKKLIGTITDGDVRRALLRGASINSKLNKYIKKKPFSLQEFLLTYLNIKYCNLILIQHLTYLRLHCLTLILPFQD